ncbi:MAG: ORF6N domain-containing protein [Erysipelotrichaceae bacterium]|nr:ORF6N domain-containing protein [Erysipelotrichaceae bacterium]
MANETTKTDENDIVRISEEDIKSRIYTVRGVQVMLDFDLAVIYGYETKNFNRQVKNNSVRFEGDDFMFQLTRSEVDGLVRCKNFTSRDSNLFKGQSGGSRYLPYAFTEQGIYMLMTVLNGPLAIQQSRTLIRVFKTLKDYVVATDQIEYLRKWSVIYQQNETVRLQRVENDIAEIQRKNREFVTREEFEKVVSQFPPLKANEIQVFCNGDWFVADAFFADLFSKAKHSIDIIDPYVDIKTLNALINCRSDVRISIWTCNLSGLPQETIDDFIRQYHLKITIYRMTPSEDHDRFIAIDKDFPERKTFYYVGCSYKDGGNSLSIVTRNEDLEPIFDRFSSADPIWNS